MEGRGQPFPVACTCLLIKNLAYMHQPFLNWFIVANRWESLSLGCFPPISYPLDQTWPQCLDRDQVSELQCQTGWSQKRQRAPIPRSETCATGWAIKQEVAWLPVIYCRSSGTAIIVCVLTPSPLLWFNSACLMGRTSKATPRGVLSFCWISDATILINCWQTPTEWCGYMYSRLS